MRRILSILFLTLSFPLFSEWSLERVIFIPPEYYVGDMVEMEILITLDREMELQLPVDKPSTDWLDIEHIDMEQQGQNLWVNIRFRSYFPGIRSIPSIDLGDITLRDLTLSTSSVSQQNGISNLRGLRDQAQLPGSTLLMTMLLLLCLILPPLIYFLINFLYRRIKNLVLRIRKKAPFKRMIRLLSSLREDPEKESKVFFSKLSGGLRNYMTEKTQIDYSSCTTRELSRRPLPGIDRSKWKHILSLFQKADLVTYAEDESTIEEMNEALNFIETFVKDWEEEERNDHI